MSSFIALYDACVLYPAPLRDLLMHLALADLFQAKWTNEIHEEWMQNVLANRSDLKRADLERTRDLMNLHALNCLVKQYERLIPYLTLPDPGDRHVLAAAFHARANVIVTFNLKDFPAQIIERYDLKTQHPDAFVSQWLERNPSIVCSAVKRHCQSLNNPPKTISEYLDVLERQGLTQTVSLFWEYSPFL